MSNLKLSVIFRKIYFVLILTLAVNAHSQGDSLTIKFADAIMERYTNINDLTYKGWEYSNSIVLMGIEKAYYQTGDEKYLNYIKRYIDSFVSSTGIINFFPDANNLDNIHPAWLCITLYEETGLEKYKKAAENIRAEFNNQPKNDSGGFWHKQNYPNQMWADGIYMAEPFLIRYGAAFNDLEYASDEVTKQVILLANHAYDSSKHLIYHGWDDTKAAAWADPVTGRSPEVWSRGMGWYCMALVDILDYLPKTHENYNRVLEILQGLAVGIMTYQDADSNLWYQVVDKGDSAGNWIETSGSAMFVYTLKKAMRKGYIDTSYNSVVNKAWEALKLRVTWNSVNQPVINDFAPAMGIRADYATYIATTKVSTPPSSHPHGYCGIMLAASEMEFKNITKFSVTTDTIGKGSVEISPLLILYDSAAKVTLTAAPEDGWVFDSWEGDIISKDNPLAFTIEKNVTVTAHFSRYVSLAVSSQNDGIIEVFPTAIGDFLYITFKSGSIYPVHIEIINSAGSSIYSSGLLHVAQTNECLKLNLPGLNPGIYLLIIRNDNKVLFSRQLIKRYSDIN